MIEVLIAIIKCGAVYVPFDTSWPESRIRKLVSEIKIPVFISDSSSIIEQNFSITNLNLRSIDVSDKAINPSVDILGSDLIYVNFTSGSTGTPKAVPICHQGVSRLSSKPIYINHGEVISTLQLASIAFDAATFEIWVPLLNGGRCILFSEKILHLQALKNELSFNRVNTIFLTTALFNTIIDEDPTCLSGIKTILTGGESHSVRHMTKAIEIFGEGVVTNVYGPTECTTFSSYYPIKKVENYQYTIPIGRPIQYTKIYILNGEYVCGVGEIGNIHIAGPGLSPGYFGDNEKTKKCFKSCIIDGHELILYDTGDRGKLTSDLNIIFEGRIDGQVKVNGFRIELKEVSFHIEALPNIRKCFVTVNQLASGEQQLLAFVQPAVPNITSNIVTNLLRKILPGYMLPRIIIHYREFPLTITQKIDKESLIMSLDNKTTSNSATKLQDFLNQKGIKAQVQQLPSSTRTVKDAASTLRCEEKQIVKSLVFQETESGVPVLVLACGINQVDEAKVSKEIGSTISKANAKYVRKHTGFAIGGVPPVGHAEKMKVVVDEDLLSIKPLWAAAGTPNAVFEIPSDITSILDSDYIICPIRKVNGK
ncbi:MAG: D-alanine--D-alanyl carrier protein ligase [Candidatus Celerinatantimonas neptuna]|nr:MAG: D-alanine--D-alanyl carrier protein ligase [Candidatus Celerinatantimonas neptuna]